MPEYPEIAARAREMNALLRDKVIAEIEVLQPKCLNVPVERFVAGLTGARLAATSQRGKWLLTATTQGWLLINLGMGGEILLVERAQLPEKRRLIFTFTDDTALTINFWWFGYAHFLPPGPVEAHDQIARLGPNVLDMTREQFHHLLEGQKGGVKALLLDQTRLAGIGNAYIHDILFFGGIHPLRKAATLDARDRDRLFDGIQQGLRPALAKGGAFYEVSLTGEKGGFQAEDIVIGYREGQACPTCGTLIEKIKTGGTTSFICPACQPLR